MPAYSNVCGQGQEPTIEWSMWKMLNSFRLQPYLQPLD